MVNKRLVEIANRLGRNDLPELPPIGEENVPLEEFSLEDLTDFYRISGINYNKGIYSIDLSRSLLEAKTQDGHVEAAIEARKNNQFLFPSYPLQHSIISALEQNKDNPNFKEKIEEIRLFIKKTALKSWLMTSTRIKYRENGKDSVIHNYNLPDQYEIQENFVDPDGFITKPETKAQPALKALLGVDDLQEINNVYKWLTEKDTYLVRVNSKVDTERVARFVAGSDRVILDCYRNALYSVPAFGVRYAPQARAKK